MVILGSEADLHSNGVHLLLRTYFSEGSYAYMVHNLHGGMPVGLCHERFKTAQEAMRKAEEVAFRAVGSGPVAVNWKGTQAIVSRSEQSRLVSMPPKSRQDIE
jgi:hypothetical protein